MTTQQQWAFRINDNGTFIDLEGQYEMPDFSPFNRSLRSANTIDHARNNQVKKSEFNRMREGADLSLQTDYIPGATAQELLLAAEGDNAGIETEVVVIGASRTITYRQNMLVTKHTLAFGSAEDENAKEMITFDFKVNGDTTKTDAATA